MASDFRNIFKLLDFVSEEWLQIIIILKALALITRYEVSLSAFMIKESFEVM